MTYNFMGLATEMLSHVAFEMGEKNSYDTQAETNSSENFMPPYLGEMGLEIKYFLPAVEPWLRAGWKIYARRPELYPLGSAIMDKDLFEQIDSLTKEFETRPIMCRQIHPLAKPSEAKVSVLNDIIQLNLSIDHKSFNLYTKKRQFEKRLKQILGKKILHKSRPSTPWDGYLTSTHNPFMDPALTTCSSCIVPSYLPHDFVAGENIFVEHIGVQLRRLFPHDERDSDVNRVMQAVAQASEILKLPILVYGEPKGTVYVDGYTHSRELASSTGFSLIKYELKALRTCRLMFSPNSGWCDLMAWLNIPTFCEWFGTDLYSLRHFRPQIVELPKSNLADHISLLLSRRDIIKVLEEKHRHPLYEPPGFTNAAFL